MNRGLGENPIMSIIDRLNKLEAVTRYASPPPSATSSEKTLAKLAADQNDYDPGNYDVIRISASATRNITGFSGGRQGRWLTIFNVGDFYISLVRESSLSLSANRILGLNSGISISIAPGAMAQLYYDATLSRWRG